MNVETLQMARDGLIDALVIPQDDSSKYGYAAIDQKEIREKISEYNMEDKVLMYPGADEVELTLLARMLNVLAGIYYRQDALRQKAMNQQISYFL